MLMKLVSATMICCLALFAQESSPQRESSWSSRTDKAVLSPIRPQFAVRQEGNNTPQAIDLKGHLKVYALQTADSREVTKTLHALNIDGVRVVSEDSEDRKIHVLANATQHEQVAALIKKLDPPNTTDAEVGEAETTGEKRKLTVTVALVQKNWAESINANKPVLEELKKLYEGVDLSDLLDGDRELQDVAPTLIFPGERASIFSYADFVKLYVRLKDLKLLETVKTEPLNDVEPEGFGPYSFERVAVEGLEVPVHEGRFNREQRPFEGQIASWSIGVGTDSRSKNSVICDRLYSQFIETDWPTRLNQIDRQIVGTEHFGGRFDLLPGEVAVFRWSPKEHLKRRSDEADDDPVFAIITVMNGTELAAPNIAQQGWAKPLKTTALGRFDYDAYRRSFRRTAPSRPSSAQSTAVGASADNGDEPAKPARFTKVFPLQQIEVTEAARLVKQLFENDSGFSMAPDVRTNSLLVSGSEQSINTMSEVLKTLDAPSPIAPPELPEAAKEISKSVQMELGPDGTMILRGNKGDVTTVKEILSQMSSQQLLDRSRYLEEKATSWTQDYILNAGTNAKDLSELKQTVTEDFEVRQRLQLAEIEFLKARLDDLERRVRQKEKLKSLIIDKRIESLLSKPAQALPKTGPPIF